MFWMQLGLIKGFDHWLGSIMTFWAFFFMGPACVFSILWGFWVHFIGHESFFDFRGFTHPIWARLDPFMNQKP